MKSNADARSSKELAYDQEMEAANDIAERQNSLENFISDEAGQFLTGRSLRVHKRLLKFETINSKEYGRCLIALIINKAFHFILSH